MVRLVSPLGTKLRKLSEPSTESFGLPTPPQLWSPAVDVSIPIDDKLPFFVQWITSYFDHGDLSTRDFDSISYIVPSLRRAPTIYTMTEEERARIVQVAAALKFDRPFLVNCEPQMNATYNNVCYGKKIKELLPSMKIWMLSGTSTASFSLLTFWMTEDDNQSHGGGHIDFKRIHGANHFVRGLSMTPTSAGLK